MAKHNFIKIACVWMFGLISCVPFVQRFTESHAIDFYEVFKFADWSMAVYYEKNLIKPIFDENWNLIIRDLKKEKARYFIAINHKEKIYIISIRGTNNIENIKSDLVFVKHKNIHADVMVHSGFAKYTDAIYNDVKPILLHKDYSVRITGHSLGGAAAVILGMYLHEDGYYVDRIVTFGQPKVTNKEGIRKYRKFKLLRVTHETDMVPYLPPNFDMDFYLHFGKELLLLDGEYYCYLEEKDAERLFVNSFWFNLKDEGIKDHKMDRYFENLRVKQIESKEVKYKNRLKYVSMVTSER